ncbi:Transposase DDE domain protein [Sporotomaculum syntrophicum]|uniref:Transposase DDE domain protein n=3 Tax=Sporotomaculum syntrophicum TaxID=182264 RepID=A0A9D3AXK0_9FIRM|nr:Transposase DDE domain protein [Sporotomaculum syntrophicum]
MEKPQNALRLLDNALNSGITADYVLMDSWFTNEPMITSLLKKGLHTIGMVKQMNQRYDFNGHSMSLPDLKATLKEKNHREIIGSCCVKIKNGIPVKIVFIQNRNNKREWLAILTTDLELDDAEIVRIYGMRWGIEVFFKSAKSLFKLGSEFQGKSFDMLIAHTTVVFTRYMLLEWERRQNQDYRSYGELFFMLCDEIQDIDFETALKQLMLFFTKLLNNFSNDFSKAVACQVKQWIAAQPSYIRALMTDLGCEV